MCGNNDGQCTRHTGVAHDPYGLRKTVHEDRGVAFEEMPSRFNVRPGHALSKTDPSIAMAPAFGGEEGEIQHTAALDPYASGFGRVEDYADIRGAKPAFEYAAFQNRTNAGAGLHELPHALAQHMRQHRGRRTDLHVSFCGWLIALQACQLALEHAVGLFERRHQIPQSGIKVPVPIGFHERIYSERFT